MRLEEDLEELNLKTRKSEIEKKSGWETKPVTSIILKREPIGTEIMFMWNM